MAVTIADIQVHDISALSSPDGTRILISTSIEDADLDVERPLPVALSWKVSVEFTTDVRSTVTCTADVCGPDGTVLTRGKASFDVGVGTTRGEIPFDDPDPFLVTRTGTHVVTVRGVDTSGEPLPIWTRRVDVSDSRSAIT